MRLGVILYALWAMGISVWFLLTAINGTSPFASSVFVARGAGSYGPGHK